MTEAQLIELLTGRFYEDFAVEVARRVCDADADAVLYALVTSGAERLKPKDRHAVRFRGAYALERIYFSTPERFKPFVKSFLDRDFAACTDASAQRHFGKIMAHLLRDCRPDLPSLERIADAAAEWAVDPKAKVAVKIWAVEVLKCCRERIGWVDESWDDIVGAVAVDATPGIRNRMRKSW